MLKTAYRKSVLSHNGNSVRRLTNSYVKVNLDFSSNDYLGLSHHPEVIEAGSKAALMYGAGATGSRLLSGNYAGLAKLESEIARCKKTEAALIFNSGFQCNMSVLSSLLNQKHIHADPIVFFDRYNHASLYQAIFFSGAKLVRYRHNDIEHLKMLMSSYQDDVRPKMIVTESVFGMDGDIAPIHQILDLCRVHGALLYLDEAHATGIMGAQGYGLSSELDFSDVTTVVMGTFSKALGVCGAYIAAEKSIIDYLINFCPGFIYSTALSPFTVGAAYAGWRLLPSFKEKRHSLQVNSNYLRDQLKALGFQVGNSSTNIIPIILGDDALTKRVHKNLLKHNIQVSCVLPPTVPVGTSRLRIALNVNHTKKDIDEFIEVLSCIHIQK